MAVMQARTFQTSDMSYYEQLYAPIDLLKEGKERSGWQTAFG